MERIQEAIEKAKRERQGKIGANKVAEQGEAGRDVTSLSDNHESVSHASAIQPDASIRVQYSDTRRVELDELAMKEKRIVAGFSHDARSEPYRQLRGQILKKFRAKNWQTLAITSPTSGSGSTLTAVNLAISLSMETNQTVMLVDLNLRQPGVAEVFGIENPELGIVQHVKEAVPLEKILINPGLERLVIIPAVAEEGFTSEILSSPEMSKVMSEIVARYPQRIIIFDLPAVLDHDDALVFAPKCDATLMVIAEGSCSSADIERSYQLLEGCTILGSVLNKVRYQ